MVHSLRFSWHRRVGTTGSFNIEVPALEAVSEDLDVLSTRCCRGFSFEDDKLVVVTYDLHQDALARRGHQEIDYCVLVCSHT